jgi:exodeoxyribonuclease-3
VRLATWNVNSIRQRAPHVRAWLERVQPDVLFLQEIKCEAPQFPLDGLEELGYRAEIVGQKSYNGVAALSRVPFNIIHRALPGLPADDAQARYIEGELEDGPSGQPIVAIGIYLPNGNSGGEAGYAYKLAWMDALRARAAALLQAGREIAILGDYNVCPEDRDLSPGSLPPDDALLRPETRARFRALLWLGLTDALRALHPTERLFTFWDYQAGAWNRDSGLRIDHALLSAGLAERLQGVVADRDERGMEKASDHVPVVVEVQ